MYCNSVEGSDFWGVYEKTMWNVFLRHFLNSSLPRIVFDVDTNMIKAVKWDASTQQVSPCPRNQPVANFTVAVSLISIWSYGHAVVKVTWDYVARYFEYGLILVAFSPLLNRVSQDLKLLNMQNLYDIRQMMNVVYGPSRKGFQGSVVN
jgi:hypothetical protein